MAGNVPEEDIKNLKKERDKYRELFNYANDAILLFKFKKLGEPLEILEANEAACKHFGYKRKELIGKTNIDIDSPETAMRGRYLVSKLLAKGFDVVEICHVNKRGRIIPVEVNHKIVKLDGETMAISVIRDITKRKQGEQKLKESLEKERELRGDLQREITQRVNFMRALVHELKTPLTSMMLTSEMLDRNLSGEPNESYAKCLNHGILDLNLRIDELLDIARGEVGLLRLDYGLIDVKELVREVCEFMQPIFDANCQKFHITLDENIPKVRADFKRIKQVMLNLLDNAAKYTKCGGEVTLSIKSDGKNLDVMVKDNGVGISNGEIKSLFQMYSRQNKEDNPSGLGIGLALSRIIIGLHEGTITVSSKEGKGSIFAFSIPLKGKSCENSNN